MRARDRLSTLDALLSARGAQMPAWQVQAMFLGALASTNMRLGPHHFLERILGDESPGFESVEQANELIGALGALWNELTEEARRGVRLSEVVLPDNPSIESIRDFAWRRHEELGWFIRGIDAGGDDPAEFGADGEALFQKLGEASAYFQTYAELPERVEKRPSERELRESVRRLRDLTRAAEGLVTDLLEVGRGVRMRALSAFEHLASRGRTDDGVQAGVRKIGRNDPCPCGSSKKWKKCCGSAPATQH